MLFLKEAADVVSPVCESFRKKSRHAVIALAERFDATEQAHSDVNNRSERLDPSINISRRIALMRHLPADEDDVRSDKGLRKNI